MQWLITGCSSGLGLQLVRKVLSAGHQCIATSRYPDTTPELISEIKGMGGIWLQLDVSGHNLIANVQEIAEEHGPIDVLVNNAGAGNGGPLETYSLESARALMDTNFFGPVQLMKALIPQMRERRTGIIVNVSSAVFWKAYPGVGMYAATKFALEGLSEALSGELAPFGVRVILAEPGEMRTNFVQLDKVSHLYIPEMYKGTPAEDILNTITQRDGKQTIDPVRVAEAIWQQVTDPSKLDHSLRIPLGTESLESLNGKIASLQNVADAYGVLAKACDFPKDE